MTQVLIAIAALQTAAVAVDSSPATAPALDWKSGVVRVEVLAPPDVSARNPAQARLGAQRSFDRQVGEKILGHLSKVMLESGRSVSEILEDFRVKDAVLQAIREHQKVVVHALSDGGLRGSAEVPLGSVLEAVITQVQLSDEGQRKVRAKLRSTGLIVDARGLKVAPALAPRILSATGQLIYGPELLQSGIRSTRGVLAYVHSLEEAKRNPRAGTRPLVLKAKRAEGVNLVLAPSRPATLLTKGAAILDEASVVVVLDP